LSNEMNIQPGPQRSSDPVSTRGPESKKSYRHGSLTRTRAENPGHVPNELMVEYYAQRTSAGLIISEGTSVSEEAQGWYGVPGIYNEEQGQAWRKVTDAVHTRGGRIFVQLWHQGGVSHPSFYPDGRQRVAPSAINPEQLVHIRGGTVMSGVPRAASERWRRNSFCNQPSCALLWNRIIFAAGIPRRRANLHPSCQD
jgi:hypothetical protein